MSTELKNESVKTGKKLKEASFEQRFDMDITLPDYCADIKKILRCTLVPGLHTVNISGERVTAKGTGTVRIIYLAEGDRTDVFEKSTELSSSVQIKDIAPDSAVTAYSVVDFVNCRAVSQRKISVSASVSTVFGHYGLKEESFATADTDSCIQTKKEKLTCEEHLGFFEKIFDMAETVALNSENPPIGKIISAKCRCLNESHKLSSGKLLIKGDAVTEICYIPEGENGRFHSFSHSMPISQIIDLRDIPDSALCNVRLRVCQQLVAVKADSSGSNRLADISLRVGAFISADEKKEYEVITDCFCTEYETEESYEKPEMLCLVREINETEQAKAVTELPVTVKEICFSECVEISKTAKYTDDKVSFDCSALVFIMYIDEKGVPGCCEKNLDFGFSYSIAKKCKEPFGEFSVEAQSLTCTLNAADKAELVLDYCVSGKIYCNYENKILKKLSVLKDKPKRNNAALTLYFAEKGEELWNIARRHNTTVELIKQENMIKSETVTEKAMLLIPCL